MIRGVAIAAAGLVAALVLLPQGRLSCTRPYLESSAPDAAYALAVCRRPMAFAMPGQGSDAPGWAVLRDRDAYIAAWSAWA